VLWSGAGTDSRPDKCLASNGNNRGWQARKERILFWAGLTLIGYEVLVPELLGENFHFEVLLTGLALCGVAITQWGDRH
jgi:hypothetical protein